MICDGCFYRQTRLSLTCNWVAHSAANKGKRQAKNRATGKLTWDNVYHEAPTWCPITTSQIERRSSDYYDGENSHPA